MCKCVPKYSHTDVHTHTCTDSVHTFYSSLGFRKLSFVLCGGAGLVSHVTKMNADALITLRSLWCNTVGILKTYLELLEGLKEFSALSAKVALLVNENTTLLLLEP